MSGVGWVGGVVWAAVDGTVLSGADTGGSVGSGAVVTVCEVVGGTVDG